MSSWTHTSTGNKAAVDMDLEALLRVPYVEPYGGFDISPDGRQVAFSWNGTGKWEIFVLPLDPSNAANADAEGLGRPRQITSGPGSKFAPRWSPDGQRLAYALDLAGEELYDIHVYDLVQDQHTNLTPDTPDAILPKYCWSPDGNWLSFFSDRAGHFDTYVMPAAGGPARLVLSLHYPDWDVKWSPNGKWLAVVSETRGQDFGTFIVPAEGGEARRIANENGPICAKGARWSPDSRWVAFSSNVAGDYNIGVYEVATGRIIWVTEAAGDQEFPAWSPRGDRLACVESKGPVTALAVYQLDRGEDLQARRLSTYRVEPGVHYQPAFTPNGDRIFVVFDNPRHPCDLWELSLDDGSFRRLTKSLPEDLQEAAFTMPEQVHYPSLDGQTVPALLYQPRKSEQTPPAVIYVHGGPSWLTQVTWDPLLQHMVSRGWVVLAPNYRGSTGYGRDWQLANRFDLGGGDTEDVVAGADYLAREGVADPARIAVTGRSWGGYLTMTCLTQFPDRWAAGSAVVPFLNWFTSHENSREDLQHWDKENFGDPEENYDLWYERSPFFFLDRVTAPVQLLCGANDVRCPASESVAARDALVSHGKVVDFFLYPEEGHSFHKTEYVVDVKTRRVAFLARYLEREPLDSEEG